MKINRSLFFASFLAFVTLAMRSAADVVSDWNLLAVKATKTARYDSNLGSRILAIESIAVYDAANSIKHFGKPYHFSTRAAAGLPVSAAVAQAAHDILTNYFPEQKESLDQALSESLKNQSGKEVDQAREIGSKAAADIIALRKDDGANISPVSISYPKDGLGKYRPTPAKLLPGIDPQWGHVKPFLLKTPGQFRPLAPPGPGSEAYKTALSLVEETGAQTSTKRTEDQTRIAQFYKQDAELTVNETARILIEEGKKPSTENAYIFMLVDIAEADARIATWDAKYTYLFWRPVTALNAETDGSVSNNYAKWTPLLSTPPHPSYPCGHCATVDAGLEILKTFFEYNHTVQLHTTTEQEPQRTLTTLSQLENENSQSRLYGGIHYPFDITAARKIGKSVAAYVLENAPHKY